MRRSFDAAHLNAVCAHPEVLPWVGAPGVTLDFTEVLKDPDVYYLANEHGGFLFVPRGEVYEVHTQILPSGRHMSREMADKAVRYMFTRTDCRAIETYVPEGNEPARRLTNAMGFLYTGRRGTWTYLDGRTVPLDWYLLTKERYQCLLQPL